MVMVNTGVCKVTVVVWTKLPTVVVTTTVPSCGIEFEVSVAVATPLALVVALKGFEGRKARVGLLTVKVTTWPADGPIQSVTVAVTVAVFPPVARGLGDTLRLKLVGIEGVMILMLVKSVNVGEVEVAWIEAGLPGVLPVNVEVTIPALLVVPGFGKKSLVEPGEIVKPTDLLDIGLPKLSVMLVVTLAV